MITPKDINKIAIIFELKSLKAPKRSEPAYTEDELEIMLPNETTAALKQIEQKSYTSELQQRGIHKKLLSESQPVLEGKEAKDLPRITVKENRILKTFHTKNFPLHNFKK